MKKKRNNTATKRTERFSLDDNTCTGVREIPFLLLCAYRDVYLCYIRTTRTHAQKRIGSCPKSNDPRISSGLTARAFSLSQIPCSFPSSACTYHQPPEQTSTEKARPREAERQERAGRKSTSLAFFLHLFILRRITIHRSAAPTLCFIMHTYFYLFFHFVLWAFWCEREVSNTASSSSEGNSERRFFFLASSFVYVSE
jgi:hypothetical protein